MVLYTGFLSAYLSVSKQAYLLYIVRGPMDQLNPSFCFVVFALTYFLCLDPSLGKLFRGLLSRKAIPLKWCH